jgi:serine/threonine-protein phosphatase 2A activator
MLEPAGSHGVWGLDDYHFIPFLLGASELIDNKNILTPDYIHKEDIVNEYSDEYMYLHCIKFIGIAKKGPFHEHSPMLNDISGAASWTKVT